MNALVGVRSFNLMIKLLFVVIVAATTFHLGQNN